MKRVHVDFAHERDVEAISDVLLSQLPNAQKSDSEPFADYVLEQKRIADATAESARGHKAFVASAEQLATRLGPGVRISFVLAGIQCSALVSRSWIRITCSNHLPRDESDELVRILRALDYGELIVVE